MQIDIELAVIELAVIELTFTELWLLFLAQDTRWRLQPFILLAIHQC